MADYTATYKSTKNFYFDLDASYVITVASPRIIESIPTDVNGVVTNVVMSIGMRVNASKNITLDKANFILFKYFSGCMPGSWKLYNNKCYRYTSGAATFMSKYNSDPSKYTPYILAKGSVSGLRWSGEKTHTGINFTPTEYGKNPQNWNGEICLAVIGYDPGSEHTYWRREAVVGNYTLQYAQETPIVDVSSSSSFQLGSTATVTIKPYSTEYNHKVTWALGGKTVVTSVAKGITSIDGNIPTSWRSLFGATETSKKGTVFVETFNENGDKIGSTKSYEVNYIIDNYNYNNAITTGNISKVSGGTRYTNSIFSNYLVSGYDSFDVLFNVNTSGKTPGDYYTKSKTISVRYNSITTSKTIESASISQATIRCKANKGSDLIQFTITDQRNKTGTLNRGFYSTNYTSIAGKLQYLVYTEPVIGSISFYRGLNTSGTRDDLNGQYGIVKFSNYKASYSDPSLTTITNTIKLEIKKIDGTKIGEASTTVASGSSGSLTLCFKKTGTNEYLTLPLDEEYIITGTVTDLSGYKDDITEGKIFSSNYLLHFRYKDNEGKLQKQKSIGIGQAGRDLKNYTINKENFQDSGLLSIAYPIELSRRNQSLKCFTEPIRIVDGGTGAYDLKGAQDELKILPTTGGTMTGNLTIAHEKQNYGGIYIKDSTGATPGALYYNGTNLWIGSTESAAAHHRGGTYISTGYNGTNGNDSIYIAIPNDSNNKSSAYKAYHAGNIFYSVDTNKDGIPDEIPGGTAIKGMIWLKPIT